MYASHTSNIANSFKKWSIAHSKRNNDNDQPSVGTSIALAEPAPQDKAEVSAQAELSAQAEHRRSFS
jgi:hypothetical protein